MNRSDAVNLLIFFCAIVAIILVGYWFAGKGIRW